MLNRDFDALARRKLDDLYPEKLRREIDWLNERIYRTVNNGVYRAGFATAQDKYEEAVSGLFKTLDWLEKRLAKATSGSAASDFTEADVRLFTTLVRFDAVYYSHFKCNLRRLVDYPNLWRWTRRVYALPGVAKTVDLKQIKDALLPQHEAHQSDADRAKRTVAGLSLALVVLRFQCSRHQRSARRRNRAGRSRRSASRCASSARRLPLPRLRPQLRPACRTSCTTAAYFYLQSDRIGLKLDNERRARRALPAPAPRRLRLRPRAREHGRQTQRSRATISASPGATARRRRGVRRS